MPTISLCLIIKNEEAHLSNCLDSVRGIVDEIILVDTGSSDQTKEIARRYTDKIFDFEWREDFSAARNFSFAQATMDYILWLDADDVFSEEDQFKFRAFKETMDNSVDSVTMIYHYAFDEFGNPTISFRRNRLVRRSRNFKWQGFVHEYLAVSGHIINSDIVVTHTRTSSHSGRNLAIYESHLARGETLSPRDLYYYGNELLDHQLYDQALKSYKAYINSGLGWVEDILSAHCKISDIYRIMNDEEKELYYLMKCFDYDLPRAETCCRLGFYFLQKNKLEQAEYWYKTAASLDRPKDNWGFFQEACWTWLPHIQLCIVYYRKGNFALSFEHNEIARTFRPDDHHVLHNKKLLEGILRKELTSKRGG